MGDRLLILLVAAAAAVPLITILNAIEPPFGVVVAIAGAFAGLLALVGVRHDERRGRL